MALEASSGISPTSHLDDVNRKPGYLNPATSGKRYGLEALFMRTHGTLTRWNDERGFGFIQPSVGTDELFVHISAFPRDGVRPRIGETISFETVPRDADRMQAVRVMRPGGRVAAAPLRRTRVHQGRDSTFGAIVGVLVVVAIGWYAYSHVLSGARGMTHRQARGQSALPSLTFHPLTRSLAATDGPAARR